MFDIRLEHPTDLDCWRAHARALLAHQIAPEAITWRISGEMQDLFTHQSAGAPSDAPALVVPRRFVELARTVICHRQPARFSLLYRLLWRLTRGERRLLNILIDPDVVRAEVMAKSVRCDLHKMKAFVRFRSTQEEGAEHFIAWFEPQHFIVERVGSFFAQRFAGMLWSILTPDRSAHWDGERLSFGPGMEKSEVPSEDALADVWRRYYASIFNPARLKLTAMKGQMPVRYWKNLPEACLIAPLAAGAGGRTKAMLATHPEQWRQAEHAISDERSSDRPEICDMLKMNTKNGEGSFRGAFPPPVLPFGKFSVLFRAPENRAISKALTEWAGYRPRRLRPIFPLSSAVFSASWELRQFSTQLGCSTKSSGYQEAQPGRVRKCD